MGEARTKNSTLRRRILTFVSGLIVLSLLGSTLSLYRITEVNRLLDSINRVSVPVGRLVVQMQTDADVFRREVERNLGASHWKDPHWKARPVPRWIQDLMENEAERLKDLVLSESQWVPEEEKGLWQSWAQSVFRGLGDLRVDANRLHAALEHQDENAASEIYARWSGNMDEWRRQIAWGAAEYDRSLRKTFGIAQARVVELRTGLEVILAVVVGLSLMILWFGERALRPLAGVTRLARAIATRGLRKEDIALFPDTSLSRDDEVSQLAREFHRMATVLLEREKTVESQKGQLQEQNRLLRKMGQLNEHVLNSIDSLLIVTDLAGNITHCNPVAVRWFGRSSERSEVLVGSALLAQPRMKPFIEAGAAQWFAGIRDLGASVRVAPVRCEEKTLGGQLMALRDENGTPYGAILALDDLTEELELQGRLRRAENLAAVGRMSAQVAHEVRNPLHSIGLEAEMAAEMAARLSDPTLKQSLQSILMSVDRLEKITENYLRLSRLSAGDKRAFELGEVLESVLATYAPACEAGRIRVDWRRETSKPLFVFGDRDLLEQAFGNLFSNAMQALTGNAEDNRFITLSMGGAESGRAWLRIEDNGPGISEEIRLKLFMPFVTTKSQGTGLGLSFVKKVLEDHEGEVRSVSTDLGGACFEIFLPLMNGAPLEQRRAPHGEEEAALE